MNETRICEMKLPTATHRQSRARFVSSTPVSTCVVKAAKLSQFANTSGSVAQHHLQSHFTRGISWLHLDCL